MKKGLMGEIFFLCVKSYFKHGERLSKVVDKTIVDVKAALLIYH